MNRAFISLVTIVATCVVLTGCGARGVPRYVESNMHEFTLPAKMDASFGAMLATAQSLGLQIDVIEKASGLVQFKNSSISYTQLGEYCHYPFTNSKTGRPFSSFYGWNLRSQRAGLGGVYGTVSLNILAKEIAGETKVTMRSKWIATSSREVYECQSNDVFEREFENKTIERLKALATTQENEKESKKTD
ncbi:MAG: hypothetical protein LBI16_02215 [Burkholderiales bacterium]|jgi:hypothetical protein|nr:hypothetical protein [Burkholderiales bacterium]